MPACDSVRCIRRVFWVERMELSLKTVKNSGIISGTSHGLLISIYPKLEIIMPASDSVRHFFFAWERLHYRQKSFRNPELQQMFEKPRILHYTGTHYYHDSLRWNICGRNIELALKIIGNCRVIDNLRRILSLVTNIVPTSQRSKRILIVDSSILGRNLSVTVFFFIRTIAWQTYSFSKFKSKPKLGGSSMQKTAYLLDRHDLCSMYRPL